MEEALHEGVVQESKEFINLRSKIHKVNNYKDALRLLCSNLGVVESHRCVITSYEKDTKEPATWTWEPFEYFEGRVFLSPNHSFIDTFNFKSKVRKQLITTIVKSSNPIVVRDDNNKLFAVTPFVFRGKDRCLGNHGFQISQIEKMPGKEVLEI